MPYMLVEDGNSISKEGTYRIIGAIYINIILEALPDRLLAQAVLPEYEELRPVLLKLSAPYQSLHDSDFATAAAYQVPSPPNGGHVNSLLHMCALRISASVLRHSCV